MFTLKKLRFKGIGRFIDLQEIDLENFGHLIQVDGTNKNTGGSSGAGKSTIFNAIDFLFGLSSVPNSMLQSRLTEEPILVEGDFDLDGQSLTISRGRRLKITLNGEVTTGSAKLTEEKLDQIVSFPRHLLGSMIHKRQGEKGFFLNFTPSEMNNFLTDCLGLSDFKNKIANLDLKIGELSGKTASLTSELDMAKAGVKASQEATLALGSLPEQEVDQDTILRLKGQVEASSKELEALLSVQKAEETSLSQDSPKLEVQPFDTSPREQTYQQIQEVRRQVDDLKVSLKDKETEVIKTVSSLKLKWSELFNLSQKGIVAKEEAVTLASEIRKIRDKVCPRCEQPWATEAAKKDETRVLEKIEKLRGAIKDGEEAYVQSVHVKKEIDETSYVPDPGIVRKIGELEALDLTLRKAVEEEDRKYNEHVQVQNKKNIHKQKEFSDKMRLLKDRHLKSSEHLRSQLEVLRRGLDVSVMKFKGYNDAVVKYNSTLDKLKQQESSYCEICLGLFEELTEHKLQLDLLEELKRAIKSYLSCSFDDALEAISENATGMIQNIPNMQNATVQLLGTKETAQGKIKEEVTAILHVDGEENVPIKTLSGGERSSIDMAVDLAVLNLIEECTGHGANFLVLDEPFNGLDSTNIEMVLEVLKNANINKKLLLTDHNPIVKEQISDRITVVRDGLTSKIA